MKTKTLQRPKQIAKYFSLPKKIHKPFQLRNEEVWVGTRSEILKHFNSLKKPLSKLGTKLRKPDTSPREIPGLSMRTQLETAYKAGGGLYRVFFITEDRERLMRTLAKTTFKKVSAGDIIKSFKNKLPQITISFVSQIVDVQPMWKRKSE